MEKPYCSETEDYLIALKEGFLSPINDDLKALKVRKGSRTDNGRNFNAWDLRYENISISAEEVGLEAICIPRGSLWELVVIFSKETGYIYFFMNNDNPEKQVESNSHYLPNTMKVFNADLNEEENSKVLLFDNNEPVLKEEFEFSKKLCEDMFGEYYDKIKRAFIIRRNSQTGQVSLVTLNGMLDFIHEELIPDRPLLTPKPSRVDNTTGVSGVQGEKIGIKLKKKQRKIS